jgi:bifunctional UDP-N-acetylglucosamine pyrophosphorylase / glucosamine-1-phosphate N-acetyltransferase
MEPFDLIVLAAGKGSRLKSTLPKVLHPLFGRPLIDRVLSTASDLPVRKAFVVVGHGREQVEAALQHIQVPFPIIPVLQDPPSGTGDAVLKVKEAGHEIASQVLILAGDVPILRSCSLKALMELHDKEKNALTLLAASLENPTGYGRVLLKTVGNAGRIEKQVDRIIEEKDATATERRIQLVNAGVYACQWEIVSPLLDELTDENNAQKEKYLTDVVGVAVQANLSVGMVPLKNPEEMLGVNTRADLMKCHQILNRRVLGRLMMNGVTVLSPDTTHVSPEVEIGADTILYPGCYLQGDISIGANCQIGPNTSLMNRVTTGDFCTISHSVLSNTSMSDAVTVGPFAHLRDGVVIQNNVRIGNFVEVKNSDIAANTNAAHLSYLGDSVIGEHVNVGAGAITANYDAIRDTKSRTILEDHVKVGSNAVLVAPVTVGHHAIVAAGSVITQDVEPWDLAIARPKQTAVPQWVAKVSQAVSESKVAESQLSD